MAERKVMLSGRAEKVMENDISYYSDMVETGGVLLGYSMKNRNITVVEAIDGGYKARREVARFEWDVEYVEHLAAQIAGIYPEPVEVVGVWHKHNLYRESDVFSQADMKMHEEIMRSANKNEIVSVLYQKNGDVYIQSSYIITKDEKGKIRVNEVDLENFSI